MKLANKIAVILVAFLLSTQLVAVASFGGTDSPEEGKKIRVINIAQYPGYAGCDMLFDVIFSYIWETNDTIYKFNLTMLTYEEILGGGKHPLNIDDFDLLVVGASFDSFYKDTTRYTEIEKKIKEFLIAGGGYIGVCAGTVFATQGYKNSDRFYKKYINKHVLGIADVYINTDLYGEAQYEFKLSRTSQGLMCIEEKVVRNNSNPIYKSCPYDVLNITYGGGPGLYVANADDPNLGDVTPLLIINEELMQTKPIHWYRKGILPGWVPFKKVETDLKGQYGAIATTYGKGRVVINTGHPEILLIVNGTIKEFIGRATSYGIGKFVPIRAVFSWTGTRMNMSHNWWVHRRAAAWITGVPDEDLPPCNELMVFMDKPQFRLGYKLYVNNELDDSKEAKKRVEEAGMTIIQGNITVEAYAENSDIVEFYLDSVLEYTDTTSPFTWDLDKELDGVHRLEIRSYDEYGNCAYDGSEFLFYLLPQKGFTDRSSRRK